MVVVVVVYILIYNRFYYCYYYNPYPVLHNPYPNLQVCNGAPIFGSMKTSVFLQTHNQGLYQLFLAVSWHLRRYLTQQNVVYVATEATQLGQVEGEGP